MLYKKKVGLVLAGSLLLLVCFSPFAMAGKEIHIAINKSPWLHAFEKLANLYEKKTGIKVTLHKFPFQGLYEKELASVTTGSREFDIMNVNEWAGPFFYSGGYMTPLKQIDPQFEVPEHVIEFVGQGYWDRDARYQTLKGILYGVPSNGNIQLLFYRADKYREAGIPAPVMWDDAIQAAKKLHNPPKLYGYVPRARRGNPIAYNWMPFLHGCKGGIFVSPEEGNFNIRVNDKSGRQALELYIELTKWAPPGLGDISQADILSLLAAGKALQAITVAASVPHMDDPDISLVPYKIEYAVPPKPEEGRHSTTSGIWTMAIPRFISQERKESALDFLKWMISAEAQIAYTKFGAVPVSSAVFIPELMDKKEFRFLKAFQEGLKYADAAPLIPEWWQIADLLGLHLIKAVLGLEGTQEALNQIAEGILNITTEAGYEGVKIVGPSS